MLAAFHGVFRLLDALAAGDSRRRGRHLPRRRLRAGRLLRRRLWPPRVSVFGQPEIDVGCFPAPWPRSWLPRIAPRAAAELILTGAPSAPPKRPASG
jgi:hypothetical protein